MPNKQFDEKCKCGSKNGMACKNCSRVKLSIMLPWKYKNQHGIKYSPVFYSRVAHNNSPIKYLIDRSIEEAMKIEKYREYLDNSNLIIVYDNLSGNEIDRFSI